MAITQKRIVTGFLIVVVFGLLLAIAGFFSTLDAHDGCSDSESNRSWFYEHSFCGGSSMAVWTDDGDGDLNNNYPPFGHCPPYIGFDNWDNCISSVRAASDSGGTILYDSDWWSGDSVYIFPNGHVQDLSNYGFNDKTSSIWVCSWNDPCNP